MVVVLLDDDRQPTDQPTGESTDHTDQTLYARAGDRDELIEELRDRVRALEEANRENRRIIAGLVQRVPELEAVDTYGESHYDSADSRQEPPQRHEPSEDEYTTDTDTEPHSASQGQPEVKRSWWRRLLFGE